MNKMLGIAICFVSFTAFAQGEDTDPVIKVKAQRYLNNHDLPPVPKGLTEPPPLPPPELHTHDIRKARRSTGTAVRTRAKSTNSAHSKKSNVSKGQSQNKGKSGVVKKTTKTSSAPAPKSARTNRVAKK